MTKQNGQAALQAQSETCEVKQSDSSLSHCTKMCTKINMVLPSNQQISGLGPNISLAIVLLPRKHRKTRQETYIQIGTVQLSSSKNQAEQTKEGTSWKCHKYSQVTRL